METVLLLPGSGDLKRNYEPVMSVIRQKGYGVEFVDIHYKATSIRGWRQQLREVLTRHEPAQTILAGFSFGGMTVFAEAATWRPRALWLFSMSCFFAEDLPRQPQETLEYWGKRRMNACAKLNFAKLAASITCPTLAFVGSEESALMQRRAMEVERHIKGAKTIIVPGAEHRIEQLAYVASVRATL